MKYSKTMLFVASCLMIYPLFSTEIKQIHKGIEANRDGGSSANPAADIDDMIVKSRREPLPNGSSNN